MKKISLFFLLATFLVNAQTQRFIYEYKYIPDINNKADVKTDLMALDITKSGSSYKSMAKIQRDSLLRAQIDQIVKTGGAGRNSIDMRNTQKPGMVSYEVTKDYPDYKVYLTERLGRDLYKIAEDEKIVWKILPDKQKIGEYNTQKATATFGGRSWIAWFATDLPFQDGPYKFYGLPGLIVKVEDTTGSHIMTLVANKKLQESPVVAGSKAGSATVQVLGMNAINVDEAQFKKAYKSYIADPAKDMRAMNSGMGGNGISAPMVMMRDPSGNPIDPAKMAKKMEENLKNRLAHDNNKIEPSLYQ